MELTDSQFELIGVRTIAIFENTTFYTKVYNSTTGSFDITNANKEQLWGTDIGKGGSDKRFDPILVPTSDKIYPGTYLLVVYNSTLGGTPTVYESKKLTIVVEPVAGKPYVSITTDRMTAALGDRVELKYKMTASENYYVGVLVTGWEGKVYFQNCSVGTWTLYPWMAPMANFDEDRCVAICMAAGKTKSECENGLKFFALSSAYGFKNTTEGY
ncbi:MAG: hypothetical protein QXQ38_04945, partial [Archaeoglobaceae archaeon]